jgi:hypothetical protein
VPRLEASQRPPDGWTAAPVERSDEDDDRPRPAQTADSGVPELPQLRVLQVWDGCRKPVKRPMLEQDHRRAADADPG